MTRNKKIIISVIAIALAAALVAAVAILTAPNDTTRKKITLVLVGSNGNEEAYVFITDKASLGELLEEKKDSFEIEWSESTYGKYISSILGEQLSASQYVSILSDNAEYIDQGSSWNTTYTYKEAVCTTSTVGADSLGLKNGCCYVLIITN